MVKLLNVIILFLMLFSTGTYAISMGTLVKSDLKQISINESAKFTLLFWNIENESYRVKLGVKEAPENWIVIINPNNFELNSSVGKEYIKLPYKDNSVKATPIDVIVKPPTSVKIGMYNIIITAMSESSPEEIGLSQERSFKLSVEIENPTYFKESSQSESQNVSSFAENLKQEINNPDYFYVLIIIIILLISYLIYKYS